MLGAKAPTGLLPGAPSRSSGRRSLLLSGMALAGVASAARGQGRGGPVKLIVPYGAGNITDQVARVFLEVHGARTGRHLVVDNQPGAGGMLGTYNLSRSPADGTILGMVSVAALAIAPHVARQQLRYDPFTDLVPVAGVSVSSAFLAVNASLPVNSLAELAAYCRSRRAENPVFYCSPGNATVPHLNLETVGRAMDFPMQHVPYRTSGAANTDLLANRVQVTMDSASITVPHMRSGTLRPLAFNAARRSPDFPEVPTFREALPEVQMLNAWSGLFFPRGTSEELVRPIAEEIRATVSDAVLAEKLPLGVTPFPLDAAQLAQQIRSDNERLGRLIAAIGLTQD
ncbi:Bug family tripartite tricarboxylate transporter substrate binding protein [Plastoroseomonas hellenica]|uniref:Bug family tripartite tricarboxylate transporter substrate binding protein n=1 Tax=Plastoroseomonas hellenica TaxID=2687306 RepID=UPI001BAC6112|nr:tripartite tricarboxylate transporter substrate binding protein [Plastoroseomonas hellenica]MBR0644854.1 tripartite tricarboxylate transporter substrate binding protein [Plastoroseomonas hellenica]